MSTKDLEVEETMKNLKLENEKLTLEIRELRRRWWKKTSTWAVIATFAAALGAFSSNFITTSEDKRVELFKSSVSSNSTEADKTDRNEEKRKKKYYDSIISDSIPN